MKNIFVAVFALILIFFVTAGCGFLNPFSGSSDSDKRVGQNKTVTDKVVETTVGESKIGIPECDEVMDEITAELNNPDDGYIAKAIKQTFLNRIKENLRESLEQNKSDKVEMAKNCREFKKQLDKFKAEQAQQDQKK
ncbi:MAG: hypothetical protein ACK42A_01515 [Pyrinomonadaceae bacterium]